MAGSGGLEALTWDARRPLGVRGSRKLVWLSEACLGGGGGGRVKRTGWKNG